MGKAIKCNQFNIPAPQPLAHTTTLAPFVIVGDQAFPLMQNLMRPFPENQLINSREKEEFNYRLSRARRVSENAFGISTNLFPIFTKPFDIRCEQTRNNLIISSCLLHNMIRDESIEYFLRHKSDTFPTNIIEEEEQTRQAMQFETQQVEIAAQMNLAIKTRETFMNYFSTTGALAWRN